MGLVGIRALTGDRLSGIFECFTGCTIRRLIIVQERQSDSERSALASAWAICPNRSSVKLYQMTSDRQAQTQSAI